jgi:uncharacterized protein (TIGR02271 family)
MKNEKSTDKNKKRANRDPMTSVPGSHPVGTGVGAVAGSAAGVGAAAAVGAAAGSAAGPVGMGVGAAAGAVAGGLAGHAVAENFNPTGGGTDLERYLDYTVVDRNNDKVGSVDAIWEDHTGQPAYIAVKTGWLGLGKAHVVPAHSAEVSDATRKIRLPYLSDVIKNAPSFERQIDIDEPAEGRIRDYYRMHGFALETEVRDQDVACEPDTLRRERRSSEDEVRVPLAKEEVTIGKREVEAGGVRLRKIIRTETVNQPVELQREEIVVERVPANERTSRTDIAFREEVIYIPLRREEPVVEKTTRTTEEVRVAKKRETERRDVSETVRREDVDIQRQGEGSRRTDDPGMRR